MTLIVREDWWIGFISSNNSYFRGIIESDECHSVLELTGEQTESFARIIANRTGRMETTDGHRWTQILKR